MLGWAAVMGLGLTAALAQAAPKTATATLTPTPIPAPAGWRLSLPGREAVILPSLDPLAPGLVPVKEAALFAGLKLQWRGQAKVMEIGKAGGRQGRLMLGDDAFYQGGQRLALAGPLRMAGGEPCLDPESLRLVLERLTTPLPVWELADAQSIAPVRAAYLPPFLAVQASFTPTPTFTGPAHVAAKPLNGDKLKVIVIDAGHGGNDPGARGRDGLFEKTVCLDIALRLGRELAQKAPDLKVVQTRSDDRYLTLRQRTEIANEANADLFVSIHNNASTNRSSRGSQVFFYDSQTSDRAAMDLVSRENEQANELEVLMTDLAKSLVRDQSIQMASKMQGRLGETLRLKRREFSYAPFYVLARTKMPAVLVEVAFLTNPHEEALLDDPEFRQRVAQSLANGLLDYRRIMEEGK